MKENIVMKKVTAAAFTLSVIAAVMSIAALAVGIVALVKSCTKKRLSASDYNFCSRPENDDDEEENIGSDTLAF